MIERSVKAEWLAAACETWPQELCQRYGFTYDCWHDEGDERVIELLGPDSPGEYVIRFHKSRLTDEHLQGLVRDIVRDITRMGEEYQSGKSKPLSAGIGDDVRNYASRSGPSWG